MMGHEKRPVARRLRVLLVGGILFAAAMPSAGEMVLARRGHPADFTIVVRTDATECERYAATELRDFLKRQTDVELPVVDDSEPLPKHAVLLGKTKFSGEMSGDDLGDEGFRIVAHGSHLFVIGAAGRGPLYGVYELLERFGGCAWYSTRFEVVPRLEKFSVPDELDETQRPAFELRTQNGNGLRGHHRLAARNKMNLEGFGPELGGNRFRFDPVLGKCHTFEALMPSARWFQEHPEYFAESDGRRTGFKTQLCLTNPDVRRICTEEVLKRVAESYPKGIRYYGVSQNDWNTFCRCKECAAVDRREKSHSGTLIEFVNHIAEAVERQYPEAVLQTLAYMYTRRPPATLVPRRNVQICLCTIECDFARPIAGSRSIENRWTAHSLRKWGSYPSSLGIWDYSIDFSCYLHPWPNFKSLRSNIKFYRDCGASQMLVQNDGAGINDIWTDLRVWLTAKWMWNPDLDEEALLQRAFRDCFGPAAADVRRAFDELHACPRDTKRFPMGCFERVREPGLLDDCIDRAAICLSKAAERAEGTLYAENVLRARLPVDFTRAIRGYARPFLSGNLQTIDPARYAEEQAGAQRVVSILNSAGGLGFAGDRAWNEAFKRRIVEFASRPLPQKVTRRLRLEEWNLIGRMPTSFGVVDDPLARDGKAAFLPGKDEVCIAWFWMDAILTDADTMYMPRLRVRTGSGIPGGEAFRAGVFNRHDNKAVSGIVVEVPAQANEVPDGGKGRYVWYSLKPFKPRRGDAIWISLAKGEKRPDVWIDCIAIERLD